MPMAIEPKRGFTLEKFDVNLSSDNAKNGIIPWFLQLPTTPLRVMNNRVNYQETKIIKNFALHAWERRDQIRMTALILQLSAPIYGREFKL